MIAWIAPVLIAALLVAAVSAWKLAAAMRVARRTAAALAISNEQVRMQAAQIDAVFSGMPDGILVVDAEWRVVRWNDRFPDVAGMPDGILRVGLGMDQVLRAQAEAGEFGAVDPGEEVIRRLGLLQSGVSIGTVERVRPNGRVMQLRRSLLDGGGFVTLYTDITPQRRAEEQLRQAQKMEAVGQLTSGIAHDFNNLLSIIQGNLELVEHSLQRADMSRTQRHIDAARAGTERSARLVQQLLAFARKQNLQPGPVDVNKVVAEMSELIRHSIGSHNHLETVLAGGLWEAVADANQLENALLNLAVNARDAIGAGGKITIETANTHLDAAYAAEHDEVSPGQFVMVAVSDNGTGMTPEEADRAFEPFYTTKEAGKGSGLGLSQVFGFVKQSCGHVKIYTEVGAGTTVKIYLPRVQAELPTFKEIEPPLAGVARALHNECVLLVEDDLDVQAYAADALQALGYRVITAADAASALLALESRDDIALLFTDIELPDLKGQDLADEALQMRPGLSVLYTTGYAANDVLHRGILGPDATLLNKPFTFNQLATGVRNALESRRPETPTGHEPPDAPMQETTLPSQPA